jgi:Cupin-like domain
VSEFRRNIKTSQRIEYGLIQIIEHFFDKNGTHKLLEKRRRKFYRRLHETLKKSGEGRIRPIERRKDLSLKEFKEHYLRKGIPVVLEGAAKDWDCVKKWSPEYFKDLHGEDEIIYVDSQKEGYPYEKIKLREVIDNIRSGGKKYYRFYPLLARHPEHIKDFDYNWLLQHKTRNSWFDTFQVFIGGENSVTNIHNANPPNLFVQVYGQKDWILYSHYHTMVIDPIPVRNAYRNAPYKKNNAPFDPFDPAYETPYTLYKYIDGISVSLQPGDVLWNPPFYWHTVKNITDSIGVGYRWVDPAYAFKIAPLYMLLDFFSRNPSLFDSHKLMKKDSNLVWLAESGQLDEYIKKQKEAKD